MKVKIPRKIKMLTHPYTIKFDEKVTLSAGTIGLTRHYYQDICLTRELPPSELNQLFLHEVLHTIERHFNIKLEDQDVDRLSEGLCIFLFENLGIEFVWDDIT